MKRMALILLLTLLLSVPAWATNWCDDAANELCLPMDEGTGTDVDDKSSNNSTCTYNGAWGNTSMPKAYMDSYIDLDGVNDYITCGDADGTDFVTDTTDFTNTFWIVEYNTGDTYERYFMRSDGAGDGWQIVRNANNGPQLIVEISGTQHAGFILTGSDFSNDSHYGVIYDWSENKYSIYVNGSLTVDNVAMGSGIGFSWTGTNMYIGSRGGASPAESHMNEVGLFSAIMDSTSINDIMDNGLVQDAVTYIPRVMIF